MLSASAVKPRISESQIAAWIVSVSPRRIRPARMRSPAVMADIGVEQIDGGSPQRAHFGDARERRDDGFDPGDLSLGESAILARRPRRRMDLSIGEEKRHCEIICYRFGFQLMEDFEIHRAIRINEATANGDAGLVDAHDRALPEFLGVLALKSRFCDTGAFSRPPEETPREDLRMQGVNEHGDTPQGNATARKALAKLG